MEKHVTMSIQLVDSSALDSDFRIWSVKLSNVSRILHDQQNKTASKASSQSEPKSTQAVISWVIRADPTRFFSYDRQHLSFSSSPLLFTTRIMNECKAFNPLTVKFVKCWMLLMNFLNEDFLNIFFKVIFDFPSDSSLLLSWFMSFWSSLDSLLKFSWAFRLIVKLRIFFLTLFNVFEVLFWSFWASPDASTTTSHFFTIFSELWDILVALINRDSFCGRTELNWGTQYLCMTYKLEPVIESHTSLKSNLEL